MPYLIEKDVIEAFARLDGNQDWEQIIEFLYNTSRVLTMELKDPDGALDRVGLLRGQIQALENIVVEARDAKKKIERMTEKKANPTKSNIGPGYRI